MWRGFVSPCCCCSSVRRRRCGEDEDVFSIFGGFPDTVSSSNIRFCFLPSSSAVACVGGEWDLVVAGLCMVLGDGVLCGGFGADGYVKVVFLCVGDRFLWMLLYAVGVYGSNGDADLASYYKVAVVWNLGRCCPFFVSVVAGGRSGRFAYQLAEKPSWNLCPTFYGGSASPWDLSSSGGVGALVPVASDSSVSDDDQPSRSLVTKQVGFDVLHKKAKKICDASPERRSVSSSALRPPVTRKTGSLQEFGCNFLSAHECSCNFCVVIVKSLYEI